MHTAHYIQKTTIPCDLQCKANKRQQGLQISASSICRCKRENKRSGIFDMNMPATGKKSQSLKYFKSRKSQMPDVIWASIATKQKKSDTSFVSDFFLRYYKSTSDRFIA